MLQSDKTNSEALTIRATVQYFLESHPITSVLALLNNALAYDPDNKKARKLIRKIKQKKVLKKKAMDSLVKSNGTQLLKFIHKSLTKTMTLQ